MTPDEPDPEPGTLTVPVPLRRPGREGEPPDVFYVMHGAPEPGRARDAEDIMLRRVPAATAARFRQAAGGRGLTHAQYLSALVALHDAMRELVDSGADERVAAELERLGLATVRI